MAGDDEKEILRILDIALKRETASKELYSRAADLAEKQAVKRIFKRLAREEKQHEEIIRGLYYKYKKRLGLKILHTDEPD
ncbi:MAG: ferritin family protein [Nitrospinota bacterium]